MEPFESMQIFKKYFYKTEEQLQWLGYSSQRNNLTFERIGEEEDSNETRDQCKKKNK